MTLDTEDRLRARYTLIDRTNPEQIAAAQQAGLPINDRGELVGDTEPSAGFGVGPASAAHKLAPSNVIAAKKQARKGGKKDKQRLGRLLLMFSVVIQYLSFQLNCLFHSLANFG